MSVGPQPPDQPATMGDLVVIRQTSSEHIDAETHALDAANQQLAADRAALADVETRLGAALAVTGAIGLPQPDGSGVLFETNGQGGLRMTPWNPASTPIPAPQAPTQAPNVTAPRAASVSRR